MAAVIGKAVVEQQRGLTRAQIILLLRAVTIIEKKQGMTYIPQWEARATMTRIFGPGGWDSEVIHEELVYETKLEPDNPQYPKSGKGQPYYVACYKVGVRATIRDYWGNQIASNVEYHIEENAPLPNRGEAHAMAMTSAESYALRRALLNFGDALGLHLYDGGSENPVIRKTLVLDDKGSPLYREPVEVRAAETPKEAGDPATVVQGQAAANALASGFDHPEGRKA